VNANELAKLLGVHAETVRRMIRNGEVKAVKQGREYVIPQEEIDSLLKHREMEDAILSHEQGYASIIMLMNYMIDEKLKKLVAETMIGYKEMERWGISLDSDPGKIREYLFDNENSAARRIYKIISDIESLEYMKTISDDIPKGDKNE